MLSSKCTCVQDLLLVFVNTKYFSDGFLDTFIYQDSFVLAQLGLLDLRLPILYTMSWPERISCSEITWPQLDLCKYVFLLISWFACISD